MTKRVLLLKRVLSDNENNVTLSSFEGALRMLSLIAHLSLEREQ